MAEETKKPSPAYVSYPTFKNQIRSLGAHVVDRIDNSVFSNMSGSSRNQFFIAMRFFKLIDDKGVPSAALRNLARADEAGWNEVMAALIRQHYPAQVKILETGTPQSLRESFGDIGGIITPAVRFLLAACEDTGIKVSPVILREKSRTPTRPRRKNNRADNGTGSGQQQSSTPPSNPPAAPEAKSLEMALLAKFPDFDPSWGPEQQTAWFDAYKRLLSMKDGKKE